MIKQQLLIFALRCLASSFGMWLCITWFGKVSVPTDLALFLIAGVIFSFINSIIKPLAKTMILPLAIITMGISTLLINIGMVWLTLKLLPGIDMRLWGIIATSLILSLINSLVNFVAPAYNE